MKTFTCREVGGPCDEAFTGETYKEVGEKCGTHIRNSTDEAHKADREGMAKSTGEDKQKWWNWFKGEWDKKVDD